MFPRPTISMWINIFNNNIKMFLRNSLADCIMGSNGSPHLAVSGLLVAHFCEPITE